MWVFYYVMYGPGHQSHESDFKYFDDSWDSEAIKEYLFILGRDWDHPVLKFWEVDSLPADYVNVEIEATKAKIKSEEDYLKILEGEECFVSEEKNEEDPIIQKNIRNKIETDLLKKLHEAGFMYDTSDISNWRYGKKCPIGPKRSEILRIIRSAESYSSIASQLKGK